MGLFSNIGNALKRATSSVGSFVQRNVQSAKNDISGFVERNVQSAKNDISNLASNSTFQSIATMAANFIPGAGPLVSGALGGIFGAVNAKNAQEELQAYGMTSAQVKGLSNSEATALLQQKKRKGFLMIGGILAGLGLIITLIIRSMRPKSRKRKY